MEPIFGFMLFAVATAVVWVVASKRGRPGWLFALACVILAPGMAALVTAMGGSGFHAGTAGLLVPVGVLLVALAMQTGEQVAAERGSYRGNRKCPHCAESIKADARVCKHCGRESDPVPAD